jgi:PAS domain S-box-containing protein
MDSPKPNPALARQQRVFGLRFRLMVLSVLTMLPVCVLELHRIQEDRFRRLQYLQEDAVRLSASCAANVAELVAGIRQKLLTLAYVAPVRTLEVPAANNLLAEVLQHSTHCGNLGLNRPDGVIVASGLPLSGVVNSSSQPWFPRVQATRRFAIGEYQVGKVTGTPGINVGMPLPDQPAGRPVATIFAAIKQEALQACLSGIQLPRDGELNIVDRKGTLMAYNPKPQDWVGKKSSSWPAVRAAEAQGRPLFIETAGIDGIIRLYHFAEVTGSDGGLFVGIGVSKKQLEEEVAVRTHWTFLWFGLAVLGALLASQVAADRWVLGPVRRLRSASQRLAAGNWTVRARALAGAQEFQDLAGDFDQMAATLAEKQRRLQESEEKLKAITMSAYDAIIAVDSEGKITFWNDAAVKMLGYARSEAIGRELPGCLELARSQEEPLDISEVFRHAVHKGVSGQTLELLVMRKDGIEVPIELSVATVMIHEQWNGIGIIRDITDRKQAQKTLAKSRRLLAETEEVGKVGGWEFDIETRRQTWTEEVYRIHEVDASFNPTVAEGINFYAPSSRPLIERAVREAIEQDKPFEAELEIITAKGHQRSVHVIGKPDPAHRRIYGFFQDITERKRAEAERERHISELKAALAEIKTLKGFIPICCGCKKIRDDKNYWEQLEVYLMKHSEAKFSHSYCPECLTKYFPGINLGEVN